MIWLFVYMLIVVVFLVALLICGYRHRDEMPWDYILEASLVYSITWPRTLIIVLVELYDERRHNK